MLYRSGLRTLDYRQDTTVMFTPGLIIGVLAAQLVIVLAVILWPTKSVSVIINTTGLSIF